MSWLTVIWSMLASACLTLALIHFFIWYRQRDAWANLLFTLTAVGAAGFAGCELAMMRSQTPAVLGSAMRWAHVPVWVIIVSLIWFVRLYLRAGRPWLAWTACVLRTLSLLPNFLTGENLNYREIAGVSHVRLFGESVSVAEGVPNPWMLVGQLSLLLTLIFVADAAIAVWRRGERRRAWMVGGSIGLFTLAGMVEAVTVFWGVIHWPMTGSLFYLAVIAAMGYELSRDVLRAAQLDRELGESERRMSEAAEAANLGTWFRDLSRNEIWANDRWRRLFGFAESDRLDFDRFLQRLHPDDREALPQALGKAMEGGGGYETEYRVVLPNAGVRWIASRGSVEFNSGGKPVRVRGVTMDITRRRLAELEAESHRNQVAHLLRVASIGELSSALAHELNQPLAAILSNAQAAQRFLAQDPSDLAEIREILRDIVADDQRAAEVIRRLRTLLRNGGVQPQPLDVNNLMQDVLELMHGDLMARAVSVVTEFAAGSPKTWGDRVQLQQVLINLVLNAGDAMSRSAVGARALTLGSRRGDGNVIRISVADTGGGFPSGDEEKIFQPYHTTKAAGLGLGLSLSRSIVVAHGGRLWAENRPAAANHECGASFHFTLPEWKGDGHEQSPAASNGISRG
jgi:two-component system sensor kinase FixL